MSGRTGPTQRVRDLIYERDGHVCVAQGHSPCAGVLTPQHRIGRGMGGSKMPGINGPANLIAMCIHHNGLIESDNEFRTFAMRQGWSIPRNWTPSLDPAAIPVRYADGPHLIDWDGNRTLVAEVLAAELWGVYGAGARTT